jgi:hypothetical protein
MKTTRILLDASMILQSFFIPNMRGWRNICSKLSRAMSEMARWQEQEDGSEERFQHNNNSSKIGEVKG